MATVMSPPEERTISYDVSWETYESLLAGTIDQPVPRFTYDRGTLETLVILSTEHEEANRTISLVVELVAAERGINVRNVGSMTFKREDLARGFEPDVSFCIQNEPRVRGVKQIDPLTDPPPDLVIEIDVSRQSLNKLPIYAAFGVPEVWRVWDGVVTVYSLRVDRAEGYYEAASSLALPPLDGEILTQFLAGRAEMGSVTWLRAVRAWAAGKDPSSS